MKRTSNMICKPTPESDELFGVIAMNMIDNWGYLAEYINERLDARRANKTYNTESARDEFYKFVNYCIKRDQYEHNTKHNYSTQVKFTTACHFVELYEASIRNGYRQ